VRARRLAAFHGGLFLQPDILAFDWISGLEPEWYSDMFGVYLFAGSLIAGIAAMVLGVLSLKGRGRLPEVQTSTSTTSARWAWRYGVLRLHRFAQYMLIWYANLPEEVIWFKHRIEGAWQPVALALPLLHFFIPFFLLIGRGQEASGSLGWPISILLGHFVDLYWLIFRRLGQSALRLARIGHGVFSSLSWSCKSVAPWPRR